MMNILWVGLILLACISACATGRTVELSAAVTEGAEQAVELCLMMAGIMGIWSGVLELMQRAGICRRLTALLRPVLRLVFPRAAGDSKTIETISANVTANLLGLSNAATPIGLRAAGRLYRLYDAQESPRELFTFLVLNASSIQLVPTTVAAVRAALGAKQPFDIMPAVWGASVCSVAAGLAAARLFAGKRERQ